MEYSAAIQEPPEPDFNLTWHSSMVQLRLTHNRHSHSLRDNQVSPVAGCHVDKATVAIRGSVEPEGLKLCWFYMESFDRKLRTYTRIVFRITSMSCRTVSQRHIESMR